MYNPTKAKFIVAAIGLILAGLGVCLLVLHPHTQAGQYTVGDALLISGVVLIVVPMARLLVSRT